MAETDMKPLSELDLYNELMDENSLLPMTVRPSRSNITRKVYFNALKTQIAGYDLVGTLTAGSTSITLSSVGSSYNEQAAYSVGAKVIYSEKNYICVSDCTAGNWNANGYCFVEYPLLDSNSNIRTSTSVPGVNPTAATIENNAITLTFPAQSSDIGVKVRVY